MNNQMIVWMIGAEAAVTMFGVGRKLLLWKRKRQAAADARQAEAFAPGAEPMPADTPLGRILPRRVGTGREAAMPAETDSSPKPRGKHAFDLAYLARLVLGMLLVGALAYDPHTALALVRLALPFVAVLVVLIFTRRAISARRAAGTA
jgi:hypothetical protein